MYRQLFGCILLIIFLINIITPAMCEMEYFPGLRRPPNWAPQSQPDETNDMLTQIIEEQARRRFQQQLAQQQQQNYYQLLQQRGPNNNNNNNNINNNNNNKINNQKNNHIITPSFTYDFSENNLKQSKNSDMISNNDNNKNINEIPFAVNPSDPRYYEVNHENLNNKLNMEVNGNYYQDKQNQPSDNKIFDINNKLNNGNNNVPYSKIKSPMEVNPKILLNNNNNKMRNHFDLNALVDKLEREGQVNAIINDGNNIHHRSDVIKKHMGIEGEMGMYIVALIAGISAAITVGLIAIGIGWYTLQKRTKAAADVDYPAYGVTGPNKDISPSGDRRLAQSAQMYHYQHQKQQIIAMENRTGSEHTAGMSDVESDDDNDEGDYTVYECPGLAPTGEMEVKNPLFSDDTPLTPATNNPVIDGQTIQQTQSQSNLNQTQSQQQQQEQQQNNLNSTKQASQKSSKSSSTRTNSQSEH